MTLPPEPSPVQVAAAAVLDLMAADLVERGEPGVQTRIAAVLGVGQSRLSDARRGRDGSLDLLARWCERWAAEGYGRIRIVVEPGAARAERA